MPHSLLRALVGLALALFLLPSPAAASDACDAAGLDAGAAGVCNAFCEATDCVATPDAPACSSLRTAFTALTGEATLPCEQPPSCACVDPFLLLDRISLISEPEHICYADTDLEPFSYVEYIVESFGVPQIGMGLEDQFDGTWYCYYFEYQDGAPGALPEIFLYDLTLDEVNDCRAALEPPFMCPVP